MTRSVALLSFWVILSPPSRLACAARVANANGIAADALPSALGTLAFLQAVTR